MWFFVASGYSFFKMPPRKKTKRTHSPTPQDDSVAQSSADTPSGDSTDRPEIDHDLILDPWTDEQETALLKAIIKWKPVGWFNCASIPLTPQLIVWSLRSSQTLSDARDFRLPQEPRICAIYGRAYAHSGNMEEAGLAVQPGSSRRAGKSRYICNHLLSWLTQVLYRRTR